MTAARWAAGRLPVVLAIILMLVHNADEAFGHPEPGGWTNLAMVAVIGAVVVAVLPRLSWIWRAVVLGLVGLDAAAQGVGGHVVKVIDGTATPLDRSGILFVAGGLILIALAVAEVMSRPSAARATHGQVRRGR